MDKNNLLALLYQYYIGIDISKLGVLYFSPVSSCNHKCEQCSYKSFNKKIIYYDNIVKLIDTIIEKHNIEFFGGEWTLHPQICEIINYLSKRGYNLKGVTNGSTMKSEILELFLKCFTSIEIQLDTFHREDYKRIHGKDDYNNVFWNITQFIEKRSICNGQCEIGLRFVVSESNKNQIMLYTSRAYEMGVDYVHWFMNPFNGIVLDRKKINFVKNQYRGFFRYNFGGNGNTIRSECKLRDFSNVVVPGENGNFKLYSGCKFAEGKRYIGKDCLGICSLPLCLEMIESAINRKSIPPP